MKKASKQQVSSEKNVWQGGGKDCGREQK